MPKANRLNVVAATAAAAGIIMKLVDNVELPTKQTKYPWHDMKLNQTAVFVGASDADMKRISRAVVAAQRSTGHQFATCKIQKGGKLGSETYPNGAYAVKYVGERPKGKGKAAKPKAKAKRAAAQPTMIAPAQTAVG